MSEVLDTSPPHALQEGIRHSLRRLLPFLLLMYVIAFLDRANVGFAKDELLADVGISNAAYALGASLFFIGYAIFEVPSNLMMHKVGARWWMARIMVTWGLISAATMFVQGPTSFYVLRILLGIAEAGFFPGVILFLTYWIPMSHRGRALGFFYLGLPIANTLGGPLSGALLELDGFAGLKGYQWMFLIEGLLAIVVGVVAFFYLTDRPEKAEWLPADEREALSHKISEEADLKSQHGPRNVVASLRNPRVLYFSLTYFFIQAAVYGLTFFLPTQIAAIIGSKVGLGVGLLTAVPWGCALIATIVLTRVADRTGKYRQIGVVLLLLSAAGIAGSAAAGSPVLALVALCFAATGFVAVQPLFWSFPSAYLTGIAAAAGIGLINSLGNLGGFVAPNIRAWATSAFGNETAGLYVLSVAPLIAAVMIFALRWVHHSPTTSAVPEATTN